MILLTLMVPLEILCTDAVSTVYRVSTVIDSDLSTDKGGPDALGFAVYDIPLCCGS